MTAAALSIALFATWSVLGYAALAVLHSRRNTIQNALLAPAVGFATMVLPTVWLNRLGLPVSRFAPALVGALVVASGGLLLWRRPLFPWRRAAPFILALAAAWLLAGRPLLALGFDWLSYATADLTIHCLHALRVMRHGFFEPPDVDLLNHGLDYSLYSWFLDMAGRRPGSQMILAVTASVTGLSPLQVFMPVILAVHLVLIAAGGALVCRFPWRRSAALATAWLLAGSALTTFGAVYQRFAQVAGLGLLCALSAVVMGSGWTRPWPLACRIAGLAGLLGAALVFVYPEVLPFAAAPLVLKLGLDLTRHRLAPGRVVGLGLLGGAFVLVGLGTYTRDVPAFLAEQLRTGAGAADLMTPLFPFYLVPSGLAQLWGFQSLSGLTGEPWLSVTILLGAGLLGVAGAAAFRFGWRGEPVALVCGVMLTVGFGFFVIRAPFGLFKLAMFVQPFLLGTLALARGPLTTRSRSRVLPLALLGLGGLYVQTLYVQQSLGAGGLSEIRGSAGSAALHRFRQRVAERLPLPLDLDTSNVVLARLAALHLIGTPATFLSHDFFFSPSPAFRRAAASGRAVDPARVAAIERTIIALRWPFRFDLADGTGRSNEFRAPVPGATAEDAPGGELALTLPGQSVLNSRRRTVESGALIQPYGAVSNHLVLVHSELGAHYYLGDRSRVAMYQAESDLLYPGATMVGVGRHLLLRVVRPAARVRLALALTAYFKGDGQNRLPPAAAVGVDRQAFPLVGRGAARVFSPVLTPQVLGGRPYVAIDMGVDGQFFPDRRRGLMRLYGTDIRSDGRRLVAFARDISLVSDEEYATLQPPRRLASFPRDLANPDLEYSGLFEDGWVSESAYVQLTRPSGATVLALQGETAPGLRRSASSDFPAELRVSVEGRERSRTQLDAGTFSVRIPVTEDVRRVRVDLRFSRVAPLPPPDNRPVAARLRSIGFED